MHAHGCGAKPQAASITSKVQYNLVLCVMLHDETQAGTVRSQFCNLGKKREQLATHLPDEEARAVCMIVESVCLHLGMLAHQIEAMLLQRHDVKDVSIV